MTENIQTYAIRLKPGEDLQQGMEKAVRANGITAGWIAAGVGSLTRYHIRFADRSAGNTGTGHFEIVSITGTVSIHGSHIHLSVADGNGAVIGGHLLEGCIVYTTAEIVLMATGKYIFTRENDGTTAWKELQIKTT